MKGSDLKELIDEYNKNRGWFRYFFGNTKGLRELQLVYNKWNESATTDDLSDDYLLEIELLLASRAERLRKRSDNYYSLSGRKKLTNNIYQRLADNLAKYYVAQEQTKKESLLIPYLAHAKNSSGKCIDSLPLSALEMFSDDGKYYVLDLDSYAATMTIEHAWHNPHSLALLPEQVEQKLLEHSNLGEFFTQCKVWLLELNEFLWAGHKLDKTWAMSELATTNEGTIYHSHTARNIFLQNLTTISYQQYNENKSVYSELELNLQPLQQMNYLTVITGINSLKNLNQSLVNLIKNIPIYHLLIHRQSQIVFSLISFLDNYVHEDGLILNPVDKKFLAHDVLVKVVTTLTQRQEISEHANRFLLDIKNLDLVHDKPKYQLYCKVQTLQNNKTLDGKQYLYEIAEKDLFITEDGYGFEIKEFLHGLTISNGFTNPITNLSLSEQDIKNLLEHVDYGDVISNIKIIIDNVSSKYWGREDLDPAWPVLAMGITDDDRIYHKDNAANYIVQDLENITAQHCQQDGAVYRAIISDDNIAEAKQKQFSDILAKGNAILALDSQEQSALAQVPLNKIFITADKKSAFSYKSFLDDFARTENIYNPITKSLLSFNDFHDLYLCLALEDEVEDGFNKLDEFVTDISLLDAPDKYNTLCLTQTLLNKKTLDGVTPLYNLPHNDLFISDDGYGFNIQELVLTFTAASNFINPISGQPFSENDIDKLSSHLLVSGEIKHCQNILSLNVEHELADVPLVFLLPTSAGLINIKEILEQIDDLAELINPLTDKAFLLDEFINIGALRLSLFIKYSPTNVDYQNYLLQFHNIPEAKRGEVFIANDGSEYDIATLLASFNLNGFIYPDSGIELADNEMATLSANTKYGEQLNNLTNLLGAWQNQSDKPTYNLSVKLKNLCLLSNNKCVDASQEPLVKLIELYLNKEIPVQDLHIVMTHEQSAKDESNIKIEPELFWRLLHNEIYTRLMKFEKPAVCVYMAIKEFESNAKQYVGKVWGDSDVIYKTFGHGSVKIVRKDDVLNEDIYPVIEKMVDDYKISFLRAFSSNKVTEFFQQTDKSGLCLRENIQQCSAWSKSLINRSANIYGATNSPGFFDEAAPVEKDLDITGSDKYCVI